MQNSKEVSSIDNKIIDRDVAETKRVNEADKFPSDYMFELSKDEKIFPTYKIFTIFTKKGLWLLFFQVNKQKKPLF